MVFYIFTCQQEFLASQNRLAMLILSSQLYPTPYESTNFASFDYSYFGISCQELQHQNCSPCVFFAPKFILELSQWTEWGTKVCTNAKLPHIGNFNVSYTGYLYDWRTSPPKSTITFSIKICCFCTTLRWKLRIRKWRYAAHSKFILALSLEDNKILTASVCLMIGPALHSWRPNIIAPRKPRAGRQWYFSLVYTMHFRPSKLPVLVVRSAVVYLFFCLSPSDKRKDRFTQNRLSLITVLTHFLGSNNILNHNVIQGVGLAQHNQPQKS